MSTIQEWNEFYHLWRWDGCTREHPSGINCDDYPLYESPATKALLIQRAMSFGSLPAISAYIRAFAALKAEGFKPVRLKNPYQIEAEEKSLTASDYHKMSAQQVVIAYRGDPSFRAQVDALIARGEI